MGDLSASDCSWKKMVIAKANNNKWVSTMKLNQIEMEDTVSATGKNVEQEHTSVNFKIEPEESTDDDDNYEMALQVMDPMSLMQPAEPSASEVQAAPCSRRKSSGPKCESQEERASRLAKMSAYAAQRLANETPEQRANRLKRMSEYAAKRLAQETTDQRAKRLSRMSAYAAKRLASESPQQRQVRLARMSAYAARRQAMKKLSSPKSNDVTGNAIHNDIMPDQS